MRIKELESNYSKVFNELKSFFNSSDFPCLFAKSSFNKGCMRFPISENISEFKGKLQSDLRLMIKEMDNLSSDKERAYYTGIFIVMSERLLINESDFIIDILSYLRENDKHLWPKGKTKCLDDQNFEFYWNEEVFFPVLMHLEHPEKIRKSPFLILAFQPGRTFSFNKNNRKVIYDRTRAAIHKKINEIYDDDKPFYMSCSSSGKNVCQYAGVDQVEFDPEYKYPSL